MSEYAALPAREEVPFKVGDTVCIARSGVCLP